MNVSLTPRLEKFVKKLVASEVLREGLRELTEKRIAIERRRELLWREIAIGLEQLNRGETVDGETAKKQILQKAKARIKQQKQKRKLKWAS